MAVKTGDEYVASIKKLNLKAKIFGRDTDNLTENPLVAPSLRAVATTFDCAHDESSRELFRVRSSLTGEEINRFTHLHQSTQDLMNKVLMQRHCGNITVMLLSALRRHGCGKRRLLRHLRVRQGSRHRLSRALPKLLVEIQMEDLVVDGAMTDPKGDRGKRPPDQSDPDLYLRVVDRKSDGVMVRGAKLHQTGMLNSHEIIVMPTLRCAPAKRTGPSALPSRPIRLECDTFTADRPATPASWRDQPRCRKRGLWRPGGHDGLR